MIKKLIEANDQSGFVLIEMLMAIGISALVLVGIIEITMQTLVVNAADTSQMKAVKQVENAIHWIERDAQMASTKWISPDDSTVTDFPLYLQWTGFEDNYNHMVTYILDDGVLLREEVVEDFDGDVIKESESFICDNIMEAESNYAFDGRILKVNVNATVSDFRSATESRTLYVLPRVSE